MPLFRRSVQPRVEIPSVSEAAFDALEKALGDDWDDDRLQNWLANDPVGAAQQLLSWGALDVQMEEPGYGLGGWTPLMLASTIQDSEEQRRNAVNALLNAGANVNARTPEGSSVLNIAVMTGDLVVLKRLLDAGADPTVPTIHGLTPLHRMGYAMNHVTEEDEGHGPVTVDLCAIADLLLHHGVDANVRSFDDGATPLQALIASGPDLATFDRLVQGGARLDVLWDDGTTAQTMGGRASSFYTTGDTLLHLAVRHFRTGTLALVEHLLAQGLDPHALNGFQDSALGLMMAEHWGTNVSADPVREAQREALALVFVRAGVDVNRPNQDGWSPWQQLVTEVRTVDARNRLSPLLYAMLDAGADLNAAFPPEKAGRAETALDRLRSMNTLDEQEHAVWVEALEMHAAMGPVPAAVSRARPRL